MKKLLLTGIFAGLAVGAYAQGAVALDNINNTSSSPTATASGLFFLKTGAAAPVLINQDFNIVFLAGTDSASLSVLASFVGSGASGGNGFGPGTFLDPTGASYPINGAITTAFFEIQAWTGPATSYAAFLAAGAQGTYGVQSLPFSNPVAVPPTPPPDLTGMPGLVLVSVPEPSTFALAGLGAAAMLIFRRRK